MIGSQLPPPSSQATPGGRSETAVPAGQGDNVSQPSNANHGVLDPSQYRLEGLDLARGVAVIGMVLVNFMYVFSHSHILSLTRDPSTVAVHSTLGIVTATTVLIGLAGRAASVFLVLFGMGMVLQTRRARNRARYPRLGPRVQRYVLLLVGGLTFLPLWEADILHFIGFFGLLGLLLVRLPTRWLLATGAAVLVVAELLRVRFEYAVGWFPGAIGSHYEDMWGVSSQLRQLLFNGYHPVFPWLSLVIYGIWLGRGELSDKKTLQRLTAVGAGAAAAGFAAQALGLPARFFPADTLFMLLGMANATWVVAGCLLVCAPKRPPRKGRILPNMGRLALSHYLGHVLLGIVPVVLITEESMDMSFEAAFGLAVLYLAITAVLGHVWLRHHDQGPLERLLRVAASRPIIGWRRPRRGIPGTPTG